MVVDAMSMKVMGLVQCVMGAPPMDAPTKVWTGELWPANMMDTVLLGAEDYHSICTVSLNITSGIPCHSALLLPAAWVL